MSVLLIIIGFMIAKFGARIFQAGEASGGQSSSGGVITLIIQLAGWGLIFWGVVRLLT